jgi:hypothetical protein
MYMNRAKMKTAFVVIAVPPELTPSLEGKGKEMKSAMPKKQPGRQEPPMLYSKRGNVSGRLGCPRQQSPSPVHRKPPEDAESTRSLGAHGEGQLCQSGEECLLHTGQWSHQCGQWRVTTSEDAKPAKY